MHIHHLTSFDLDQPESAEERHRHHDLNQMKHNIRRTDEGGGEIEEEDEKRRKTGKRAKNDGRWIKMKKGETELIEEEKEGVGERLEMDAN